MLFRKGGPELLKAGEVPGEGLRSELADVLRLQVCSVVASWNAREMHEIGCVYVCLWVCRRVIILYV